MTYDLNECRTIGLWVKSFLQRALEADRGHWKDADPIPSGAAKAMVEAALAAGFRPTPVDAQFATSLREEGIEPPPQYTLDTEVFLAQLHVYRGELALMIPYSEREGPSIGLCSSLGRRIAEQHGLGYWDPEGEAP
jgi:hypothetical protein